MNVKCQGAVFIAPYTKQNCSKSKLFCSVVCLINTLIFVFMGAFNGLYGN